MGARSLEMLSSGYFRVQTSFYRFFLTSSASEVSAPCDPDRTEVGIVALADHYNTQGP